MGEEINIINRDSRVEELLMEVDTDIKLTDVILSEENRLKLNEFMREIKYTSKLKEAGLTPMNRLLFYGDSGCGKTYLSKALSNHIKFQMCYIDIAQSIQQGNVAENLHLIFDYANKKGRCIIFLDECDSIAWLRDSKNSDGGDIRRVLNSLFQHLDQMNPSNVFISATNMLPRLDPAFERRFDMKFKFRKPEIGIKDTINKFMLDRFELVDDIEDTVASIIERRASLSYSELENIVNRSMKRAVLNDTVTISIADIFKDIAVSLNIDIEFVKK